MVAGSEGCLTFIANTSLPGPRVIRELETLMVARGKLRTVVSDNVLCMEAAARTGQGHVGWRVAAEHRRLER